MQRVALVEPGFLLSKDRRVSRGVNPLVVPVVVVVP